MQPFTLEKRTFVKEYCNFVTSQVNKPLNIVPACVLAQASTKTGIKTL